MRRAFVRRLRHWLANRGWKGLLVYLWDRARWKWRGISQPSGDGTAGTGQRAKGQAGEGAAEGPPEVHPFDRRYGVETSGLIWSESLGSGRRSEYWATGYYGVSPSILWQMLDRLGLDWPSFTFVDIGCGKGRAMMLALRYPFRRVRGVELSAELAQVAQQNLDRFEADWRLPVPVEVVAGDAVETPLPAGPLLLYLYHPFAAPVMDVLLKRVQAALQAERREIYLMYLNPELDGRLASMPYLERVWRECFALSEEDAQGDRFGSRQEYVSAYRFVLPAAVG